MNVARRGKTKQRGLIVILCSQRRDDSLQSRVLGSIPTQQRVHQPQLPVTGGLSLVVMVTGNLCLVAG